MQRQLINFSRYARQIDEINDPLSPDQKSIQKQTINKMCDMFQAIDDGADTTHIEMIQNEINALQLKGRF